MTTTLTTTDECFPDRQRDVETWWWPSHDDWRYALRYGVLATAQPETWGLCVVDNGRTSARVCPYARWTITTDSLHAWLLAQGVEPEVAAALVHRASEKRELFADLRESRDRL